MEFLNLVLTIVAGLVGFPLLLAALINLGKLLGIIPDGAAPTANMIGNLIAYVVVAVLVLLGKTDLIPGVDVQLSALADLLLAVGAFLVSLKATKASNDHVLEGLPLVGYAHDKRSTHKKEK